MSGDAKVSMSFGATSWTVSRRVAGFPADEAVFFCVELNISVTVGATSLTVSINEEDVPAAACSFRDAQRSITCGAVFWIVAKKEDLPVAGSWAFLVMASFSSPISRTICAAIAAILVSDGERVTGIMIVAPRA